MREPLIPKTKGSGPVLQPRAPKLSAVLGHRHPEKTAVTSHEPGQGPLADPKNTGLLARCDERFADFLDYAQTYLGHSAQSLAWYQRGYANFRRYLLEGTTLAPDEFATRLTDIEGWVRWNRRRGLSPIATNTYWRALRAFFKDLEKRDGSENPFRGMKAPPVPTQIPKALDGTQCQRVLAAAQNYPWSHPRGEFKRALGRALVGVMLLAGLRRSEVVRLQYDDVRLDAKQIRILRGKGRGGGKDRMAYIAPDLAAILYDYLRERRRLGIVIPEFFALPKTGGPMTLEGIHGILRRIATASGVKFSPHVLRHSFVSHLIRSGVSLAIVRDLAGHADITTTMGYIRVFDEDREEAMRRMTFR